MGWIILPQGRITSAPPPLRPSIRCAWRKIARERGLPGAYLSPMSENKRFRTIQEAFEVAFVVAFEDYREALLHDDLPGFNAHLLTCPQRYHGQPPHHDLNSLPRPVHR